MENCEQYSLRALKSGYFPCYSCTDTAYVFLETGEVWKYGERCDQNDPRHTTFKLEALNLEIFIELRGNKIECYKEQQRKIYNYPFLPENQKRIKKLGHPPGNKQDS